MINQQKALKMNKYKQSRNRKRLNDWKKKKMRSVVWENRGKWKKEASGKQEKRHLLLLLHHLVEAPKREQTTRKLSELECGRRGVLFQQIRGSQKPKLWDFWKICPPNEEKIQFLRKDQQNASQFADKRTICKCKQWQSSAGIKRKMGEEMGGES